MLDWNKSYETGNRLIDAEHRILFEIANDVANHGLTSLDKFKETYLDLVQYATLHFASEETLQREIGYQAVASHQNSHRAIVEEMRAIITHQPTLASLSKELEGYLQRWIVNHILREDMAWKPVYVAWRAKRLGH